MFLQHVTPTGFSAFGIQAFGVTNPNGSGDKYGDYSRPDHEGTRNEITRLQNYQNPV
ncbi:MAG: hypothetical protein ACI9G1_004937 [Pirellulaceae bacterium]|jgi:hypothetical protein